MTAALATKVEALVSAAADGRPVDETREDLIGWCRLELVPHALAEEGSLYAAAQEPPESRLLVEAMTAEHAVIPSLVDRLGDGLNAVRTAAAAASLQAVLVSHVAKEDQLVLPLLASAAEVSLADLVGRLHGTSQDLVATTDAAAPSGRGGHACGCGETDADTLPELDAREVPHAIRNATIFGALDGVPSGSGLALVAPHDPLPLLAQIAQREPGAFEVDYLERGPDAWRIRFHRRAH